MTTVATAATADLVLERRPRTQPVDDADWAYRVRVSATQAVLGVPRFGSVDVRFERVPRGQHRLAAPYTWSTRGIYLHLAPQRGRGVDAPSAERCAAAIRLIQEGARLDRAGDL